MKKVFAAFVLVLTLSPLAHATQYEDIALCDMEAEETTQLQMIQELNIKSKKVTSLSPFLLDLVNKHLIAIQYTTEAMSFNEIKMAFTKGEEKHNDLYINTMKSFSGKYYVEVKSYPGDNPYAHYFDAQGKLVGLQEDSTLSLIVGNKTVYCIDIAK